MNNRKDSIIPEMMGTEHELSVVFNPRKNIIDDDLDSFDSLNDNDYTQSYGAERLFSIPSKLNDTLWENGTSSTKIIKNGSIFMEYTERPLEIATPECSSPKQLVTYSLASRMLISEWAKTFLEESSKDIRSISLHERVIDSYGNTWGEHDNFSINKDQKKWGYIAHETPAVIWLHALTRGCVSGAGHVNGVNRNWTLSQKMPTVTEIFNKKWGSTGFFNIDSRIEIRCSDKNISHWAHVMRIGSMAMVLALAQTGYDSNNLGLDADSVYDERNIGAFDRVRTNIDGQVNFTHDSRIGISIQKSLAETCLDAIGKGDIDDEYKMIARSWLKHCEDLEKAVDGDEPLDLTKFVHTDWASKFYYIQQKINLDKQMGIERSPFDYSSMAQDLYYDRLLFDAPEPGGKIYTVEGTGYKLNRRLAQRNMVVASAVVKATQYPPETTRAYTRVQTLKNLNDKNYHIDHVDWDLIEWIDENNDTYKEYF